jgi:HAD superfamily hydrolase (TIGR01509 family)
MKISEFGALFDLDDVLVDSEQYQAEAYRQVFDRYAVPFSDGIFYQKWTVEGLGVADYLKSLGRDDLDPADLKREKRPIYHRLIEENVPLIEGVEDVLQALSSLYHMAVVTSNDRVDLDFVLGVTKLWSHFDLTISSTEAGARKPDPAGFRRAADMLHIEYPNCVVFGDAQKDIDPAKGLGMKAIAIPTEHSKGGSLDNADVILTSIKKATPELVSDVLRGKKFDPKIV